MKLLVATRNEGKLKEIRQMFEDTPVEIVGLADLRVAVAEEEEELERFERFSANALAKAEYFQRLTGLPTLADDSGLVVDALDGEPGVRSKRYAPPELKAEHGRDAANNLFLLQQLEDIPESGRTARFHCSMALVLDHVTVLFDGRVDGVILREPRGEGGFGYDPLFLLQQRGVTTAELSPRDKNEVSHRGRAARKARDWIVDWLEAKPGSPHSSSEG